jgi:hypothetical protein
LVGCCQLRDANDRGWHRASGFVEHLRDDESISDTPGVALTGHDAPLLRSAAISGPVISSLTDMTDRIGGTRSLATSHHDVLPGPQFASVLFAELPDAQLLD